MRQFFNYIYLLHVYAVTLVSLPVTELFLSFSSAEACSNQVSGGRDTKTGRIVDLEDQDLTPTIFLNPDRRKANINTVSEVLLF